MPRGTKISSNAQQPAAETLPTMESAEALTTLIDAALEKHFSRAETTSKERFSRLEQRFDSLQADLALLKDETRALRADYTTLRTRTVKVESTTASLSNAMKGAEAKLADLEDRSRRNNICIHGLPEGREGSNIIQYLTTQLPVWFPTLGDNPPEIMRAHRVGTLRGNTSKSRVLIFVCLRYTDRIRILKAARDSPLEIAGKEVSFTADYSAVTRSRRKSCYTVMEKARQAGFLAFLIYPATIKLTRGHDHNFFDDPAKVEDFLEKTGSSPNI